MDREYLERIAPMPRQNHIPKYHYDEMIDLLWDTPGPNAIDRFKAGKEDLRPRDDYRYFNPATEYTELDYKEFVDYGVTWEEYYVKAEAIVQIDGKVTRVDSSGLGGVGKNENEGNAAFNEYWDDERADLADKLKQVGFSDREIRSAPILKPGQY